VIDQKKQWQKTYRENNKDKLREYARTRRRALKTEALNTYGTACAVCGFDDIRALQIDHIHNNGNIERKALGGQQVSGWRFYEHLKKLGWPSGYQTLCANHNLIKHFGDEF
jgi:5-methylcytosine-specific restriction endonuclease McrA